MIKSMIDAYTMPAAKIKSKLRFNPFTKKSNKEVTLMYKANDLYLDDLYTIYHQLEQKNASGIDMNYSGKLGAKSVVRITTTFE